MSSRYITCDNCNQKNEVRDKSRFLMSGLIVIPPALLSIFIDGYDNISVVYKLLILLIWVLLVSSTAPFFAKFYPKDEIK